MRDRTTRPGLPQRCGRVGPFGLRTRLVLTFLPVAALGYGTTAAFTYGAARNAVREQAQGIAISAFRQQVQNLTTPHPVASSVLRRSLLRITELGKPRPWRVYAKYGTVRVSYTDQPTSSVITADPRDRAQGHSAR
jgi:two-component system sensor histidine kinase MtrB